MKTKKLVCGVGINDLMANNDCPYYRKWYGMIRRCYGKEMEEQGSNYANCKVSEEWLTLSVFKSWMEKQDWQDKELDKDLLVTGNTLYSEGTCLFITKRINNFIARSTEKLGKLPVGVYLEPNGRYYKSAIGFNGKIENLGTFTTPLDAHKAWLVAKTMYADRLAESEDDERVSEALRKRYREYKDPYFVLSSNKELEGIKLYCGVGDSSRHDSKLDLNEKASKAWRSMIKECYGAGSDGSLKVYTPWLTYNTFQEWWESHGLPDTYNLDRTLLDKDSIGYYPDTCYLVPAVVYSAISDRFESEKVKSVGGRFICNNLPNGVFKFDVNHTKHINSKFTHGYCAKVYNGYTTRSVFNLETVEDARNAYEVLKNKEMIKVAESYKDILREDIYENLKEFRGKR